VKPISLAVFRNEVAGCDNFVMTMRDAFSPIDVSVTFNRIHICVSASQYICLKNDCSQVVIKHIKSIRKRARANEPTTYVITCNDYRSRDTDGLFEIELAC